MKRCLSIILVLLGLRSVSIAGAEPTVTPAKITADCYNAVASALKAADGHLTSDVRNAYLDWAEKTELADLRAAGQKVPESCLAEVRRNAQLRAAIFGAVFPPDPSILQNYAKLRAQLSEDYLARYQSLVIAVAVSRRTKGVETGDQIHTIGRDYQSGFWTDESLQTPGSNEEKRFVRCAADYMNESKVSASDLYQNSGLQEGFRAYLSKHGVAANWISEVKKSVSFGERLKYALVLLNQRPASREPKPDAVAWMKHLIENNEAKPTSTPDSNGKPMPWPLFPIDKAPWPLLMPLAHAVPLSEADYIWEAFQGEHGPDRYHTYGPYRGDDDLIANSLNPSKWHWDAWPDRIVHGGMCVPISKGTVDLYSALGKPAMWAGQPGHANLISFQYVDGRWTSEVEQAFAGGPDVTFAQWYFDEDAGTEIRYRDLYYWPGAEYHLGLPLGMDVGLSSYMDTRLAAILFRVLPQEEKPSIGVKLLRNALGLNPFNPEIWYRLAEHAIDSNTELAVSKAAVAGDASLISSLTGDARDMHGTGTASDQYWHTLAQFVPPLALLGHPAPLNIESMRNAFMVLKSTPGVSSGDLAAYAERYLTNPADPHADNSKYDESLATAGDEYGLLRMGQRYRDGDGVPESDTKARELLARAAKMGDVPAAILMANMTPTIPAEMITVTASAVDRQAQPATRLLDGAGMTGFFHDNDGLAHTMWFKPGSPALTQPARGLAPSPAWVRFKFDQPIKIDCILIWNHNQGGPFTARGFRKTHIYGSTDGVRWAPLTAPEGVVLPRASGEPTALPIAIPNSLSDQPLSGVIIAAEGNNYGNDCYGLSAVRFVAPKLAGVLPAKYIKVTASSVDRQAQPATRLIDGAGMSGSFHDNDRLANTMWFTTDHPSAKPPVPGLPASPAWVRFDFEQAQQVDNILIWNLNQNNLTERGIRKYKIYATTDGGSWHSLKLPNNSELPRGPGTHSSQPITIPIDSSELTFKSVIIAADEVDGNYGNDCYGLSAVRFVVRR